MTETVLSISQDVTVSAPLFLIEVFLKCLDSSTSPATLAEQRMSRKLHKSLSASFLADMPYADDDAPRFDDWDTFTAMSTGLNAKDKESRKRIDIKLNKLFAEHARKLIAQMLSARAQGPDGNMISAYSGVGQRWLLDFDDVLADALGSKE